MGGRVVGHIADEAGALGLICLGFPFHPPGRPEKLRHEHLSRVRTPTLILQGSRDPFGSREEVAGYRLSPQVRVSWIEDGDHSYRPRKRSGRTEQRNLSEAVVAIVDFVAAL